MTFPIKCIHVVQNSKNTLAVSIFSHNNGYTIGFSLLAIHYHCKIQKCLNFQSNTSFQYHHHFIWRVCEWVQSTKSGSVQVSKWKIKRTKTSRWIQHSRMWTKGMKMWLIPPKNPWVECVWEPWCCMGALVCQECLLPAIFHCAETCTHRDATCTLSFLSWLSCNTRESDSSFPQMWSSSLHIRHQNLPMEPGRCIITVQESTTHG